MSYLYHSLSGYGVSMSAVERNGKKYAKKEIEELLAKAPKTKSIIDQWIEDSMLTEEELASDDVYNDFETDDGDDGYAYGIEQILADAVGEIEGICLEYRYCEEQRVIIYPPSYPWQTRQPNDNLMTQESLDAIFLKYFGIKGDYETVYYFNC